MYHNLRKNVPKTWGMNRGWTGVEQGDDLGMERGWNRDEKRLFFVHEADLSPWLRDGVSAFLTLWTSHCPWCHIAPGCKTMPLAEPLP
jgi:hypothetical protein